MSSYQIEEIHAGDLEQCAEVIRQGFSTVASDFGLTAENCPTNGAFIKADRLIADMNKGNLMYGLFADDCMAGFMQLEKKSCSRYELEKITVIPQFRHSGLGKKLLDFAMAKAKGLGAEKLTIGIIEENSILKNWYTANGFVHTGTKKFDFLPFTVGFMEATL